MSLPRPLPEPILALWRRAPIAISDQGSISIAQIRTLAERRVGLRLLIVDHIGRVAGGRRDNRVLEVGDVARGLKSLAKDLRCTVVAICQLNRRVEGADDKEPKLSDLRECVASGTLVWLADGRRVPIDTLVGMRPRVWAMDEAGALRPALASAVWKVGHRKTLIVRLASGRAMRVSPGHRFRCWSGYVRADHLALGSRIALARGVPDPLEAESMSLQRIGLLAHLIGDGSYLPHRGIKYTTASEDNSAFVREAAITEFGSVVRRYPGRGSWHSLLFVRNGNRWKPSGLGKWLMDLGIYGQRSQQKRVPEAVFRFNASDVGVFLRHLWSTDGCLRMAGAKLHGGRVASLSTSSGALAHDVAALLLRLGIHSRIRGPRKDGAFLVVVSGRECLERFLREVGCFGPKVKDGIALRAYLSAQGENNPNVDTLPIEVWAEVKSAMGAAGISQRRMSALRGTTYGGTSHFRFAPSRRTVLSYADLLNCDVLRATCTSNVFWDRVAGVDSAAMTDVYDLTVPEAANWCSEGIITHNSGEIEQEADSVVFLWTRERDTTVANLECFATIAKNRHGPTAKVATIFDKTKRRILIAGGK